MQPSMPMYIVIIWLPGGSVVKNPPANAGDSGDSSSILGQEDPLEKGIATHSSNLAWEIPWTEEPDRLQSIGSQRVGHGWATECSCTCACTRTHTYTHTHTHTNMKILL